MPGLASETCRGTRRASAALLVDIWPECSDQWVAVEVKPIGRCLAALRTPATAAAPRGGVRRVSLAALLAFPAPGIGPTLASGAHVATGVVRTPTEAAVRRRCLGGRRGHRVPCGGRRGWHRVGRRRGLAWVAVGELARGVGAPLLWLAVAHETETLLDVEVRQSRMAK